MTFVADEGVDGAVVKKLREHHSVFYVAEMSPGITDDAVLALANNKQALLITEDKDFGELVFRLGRVHHGIILLRLHGLESQVKADLVEQTLQAHAEEMMMTFSVLSPQAVRIRAKR